MYFRHASQIWQEFPQLNVGLLVVGDIHPKIEVTNRLEPYFDQARQRLAQGPESQLPEIAAWRRAYTQMGLKPTKYRSAAEALLRRFKREDNLPQLHPLVDLCNAVSLAFALPIAVFDLDHVDSYLEVRRATGNEEYLAFSGNVETPPAGEVIFADAAKQVHARRWTFRQSRRSTISPQTSRVLIVSEAMHETGQADESRLIELLAQHLSQLWATPDRQTMLTSQNPQLDF